MHVVPVGPRVMNELWTLNVWMAKSKVCPKKQIGWRYLYAESLPTLWYSWHAWCSLHVTINHRTSFCSVCRVGFNIATYDALVSAHALITMHSARANKQWRTTYFRVPNERHTSICSVSIYIMTTACLPINRSLGTSLSVLVHLPFYGWGWPRHEPWILP